MLPPATLSEDGEPYEDSFLLLSLTSMVHWAHALGYISRVIKTIQGRKVESGRRERERERERGREKRKKINKKFNFWDFHSPFSA